MATTLFEFWEWLLALPPDFAFLLSLPFLVAFTAALAELGRKRRAPRHLKKRLPRVRPQ
jgi:hypothetical protein